MREYSSSFSSSRSSDCSGGTLASSNAGQCHTEAENVVVEAEQKTRRALSATSASSAASCGALAAASNTSVASSA